MKFILILACLALYVAHIQGQKCTGLGGLTSGQTCSGGRDSGHLSGRNCRQNANNNMWYYNRDREACLSMSFLGCGGNNNRWCTKRQCERNCPRRRN